MMHPGLVSVTFKQRPYEEAIRFAQAADLKVMEWHGERHVPHGDLEAARRVGERTRDAGLSVAAYGSYYVLGKSEQAGLPFEAVLKTAEALTAPMIRVWAGRRNPDETAKEERKHILKEARRVADMAAEKRIKIVLEFHKCTLTQTGESAAAFLSELRHPNVFAYWQPLAGVGMESNLEHLRRVLPWLVGLHVFHWGPTDYDRHPLAQGEREWIAYLDLAGQADGDLNIMLEFVRGDAAEQFHADAATLHRLLA